MRYQKPIVMDLGSRARLAAGGPLACISGPAATNPNESCGTGDSAEWSCDVGNGVVFGASSCIGGSAATPLGSCFSGTVVDFRCEVGSGGASDPYGCQAGPSFFV